MFVSSWLKVWTSEENKLEGRRRGLVKRLSKTFFHSSFASARTMAIENVADNLCHTLFSMLGKERNLIFRLKTDMRNGRRTKVVTRTLIEEAATLKIETWTFLA